MLHHFTICFYSGTTIEFDEEDIMQMTLIVQRYRRQHHEYSAARIIIDPVLDRNGKPVNDFSENHVMIRRKATAGGSYALY